jgi:hypothetical protein
MFQHRTCLLNSLFVIVQILNLFTGFLLSDGMRGSMKNISQLVSGTVSEPETSWTRCRSVTHWRAKSGEYEACFQISRRHCSVSGPGSVVGIATGYGLDGPGIESRWGRDFPLLSSRPWGPPSFLYNGYRVFPGGKKRPGRDADTSPLLVPLVMKVELYLYSLYGPYGLYRASVPVQGCTLPLPFS